MIEVNTGGARWPTRAAQAAYWRDVAVGAFVQLHGAAAPYVGRARTAAAHRWRASAGRTAAVPGRTRDTANGLAASGAAARRHHRRRVAGAAEALLLAAANSPVAHRVVDVQVDRVARRIVDAVLAEVLTRLESEPGRVLQRRADLVDELVERLRSPAGDR